MHRSSRSASIVVHAAAADVFAIVTDPRRHGQIDGSGSVRGMVAGPARLERGSTFGIRMRMFGVPYRISNRVVEFEQDRRIAWRHFAGHRWRYELEPAGASATKVTETFDVSRMRPWAALIVRAAGFPERNLRGIRATLQRLKLVAEQSGMK